MDHSLDEIRDPQGVWMAAEEYESLVVRATANAAATPSRISWPECVFSIFAMFFFCVVLGILLGG